MVVKPLRQRWLSLASAPATPAARAAAEASSEHAPVPRRPQRKASTYEHGLNDLKDMAKNDPAMVAMIVRNWMKRDGQ
jgi:flagellar M-ring protein FliF